MLIVTSLDGFVRAGTLREPDKLQPYLAFARSTTPIPAKGCAGTLKVATLPRVRSLDHANRRKIRKKMHLYLAFGRSTTPIHVRAARHAEMLDKMCNFTSRWRVRPRQSMGRVVRDAEMLEKMCNFTSRSRVRPRQSLVRVARHAEKLQLYLAFARSTTPIPGKGCPLRRKVGKRCNFTSRSRVRPRQSMVRVARHAEKLQLYLAFARSTAPIHGKGCALRRRVAILRRVSALDHANPW